MEGLLIDLRHRSWTSRFFGFAQSHSPHVDEQACRYLMLLLLAHALLGDILCRTVSPQQRHSLLPSPWQRLDAEQMAALSLSAAPPEWGGSRMGAQMPDLITRQEHTRRHPLRLHVKGHEMRNVASTQVIMLCGKTTPISCKQGINS